MTSEQVQIVNKRGLHARASAKFVALAGSFDADILVSSVEQDAPTDKVCGTSIMGLMIYWVRNLWIERLCRPCLKHLKRQCLFL